MTENKRFKIADYPSDIEDTLTGKKYAMSSYGTHMEIICDLLNSLNDENEQLKVTNGEMKDYLARLEEVNEQLKNRVDELEDDNMKYTLSTDKLEGYTKRFVPTKCIYEFRDCKTNRYYWLDYEDNFTGALELLNLLDCENEQLKKDVEFFKGYREDLEEVVVVENEKLKSEIIVLLKSINENDYLKNKDCFKIVNRIKELVE